MKTKIVACVTPTVPLAHIKEGEAFWMLSDSSIRHLCMRIQTPSSEQRGCISFVVLETGEYWKSSDPARRMVHRAIQTSPGVFKRETS